MRKDKNIARVSFALKNLKKHKTLVNKELSKLYFEKTLEAFLPKINDSDSPMGIRIYLDKLTEEINVTN